ncbi:MAG: hypothetical protein NTX03_04640, partial [Bacteroidetes bacterium]|nr:hypothetical protein [Bacteroidota bacterium]
LSTGGIIEASGSLPTGGAVKGYSFTLPEKEGDYVSVVIRLYQVRNETSQTGTSLSKFKVNIDGTESGTQGSNIESDTGIWKIATTGIHYSGSVSAQVLTHSTDKIRWQPANNEQGEMQMIDECYGLVDVIFQSQNGKSLQIENGKKAKITFNIPTHKLATAPATVPLCYLDKVKNLWVQEGTATKVGNSYVGEVNHFTFWSINAFQCTKMLTLTLKDANGNIMPNLKVFIKELVGNTINPVPSWTAYDGKASGYIPCNRNLSVMVYGPCNINTPFYTQNIGPFNAPTNMTITIPTTTGNWVTLKGKFVSCNGAPFQYPASGLYINNDPFFLGWIAQPTAFLACPLTTFSFTFQICSFPQTIKFYGNNSGINSDTTSLTVTQNGVYDYGNIAICPNPTYYIKYKIGNASWRTITDSLSCDKDPSLAYIGKTRLRGKINAFTYADFLVNSITTGTNISMFAGQFDFGGGANYHNIHGNSVSGQITQYGAVGADVVGINFNGGYNNGGTNTPIQIKFKVKRTQ